jgi:hypothetical protein
MRSQRAMLSWHWEQRVRFQKHRDWSVGHLLMMIYLVLFMHYFCNNCYEFTDESTSYHEGPFFPSYIVSHPIPKGRSLYPNSTAIRHTS